MRSKRPKEIALKQTRTLVITTVSLLTAAGALAAATNGTFSSERSLADQIKNDIARAVHANAHAESALEWRASGYRPSEIIENVRDFKSSEAEQALCDGLSALTPVDLALFEEEISDEENKDLLPCKDELEARIKRHWMQARTHLAVEFPEQALKISTKSDPIRLSSREIEVDAAEGPLLVRGALKDGEIAFTFDDGPHGTRTPRILEILNNAGVRAIFFQVGEMTRNTPEISKRAAKEGHIVASHTWSHPQLPKLAAKDAESEIRGGRETVALASGTDIPFFRFPYGARNSYLDHFVKSEGMASFLWNMDSADWKLRDPKVLLQRVKTQLDREKGGIILFHDIHEQTVIVLPYVIAELKARGFSTVLYVPKK